MEICSKGGKGGTGNESKKEKKKATKGREGITHLIMTIQLQIFLHLHRIRLGLRGLGLNPLRHIGEDLLGTEHAIGVETTVAPGGQSGQRFFFFSFLPGKKKEKREAGEGRLTRQRC
jgi:hypothetical protein